MTKAQRVEDILESLAIYAFGRSRAISFRSHVCVCCGTTELVFRDKLSEQEYLLTGMCQKCQDIAFALPTEEEPVERGPEDNYDDTENTTYTDEDDLVHFDGPPDGTG